MFELVITNGEEERSVYKAEKMLDVELERQRHIRSLAEGIAEVREVKEKAKK